MANSTTNVDTVIASQASKEVTINAALDAASQALTYGRRASTSSGLTWGYYGGNVVKTDGTMAQIANGTLTLTASNTNYIVAAKATGAVSVSTANTNWLNQTDYWRLYEVVAGAATVTSYTDSRDFMQRPAVSSSETTTTIGALINGADAKTTPIDADMVGLMDSAASNILKKLTWANIKATLKTYFDALYQAASATLSTWAGITPGTGVGTALSVDIGSSGAVVTNGGALGTPSSGTLTSCTGLPAAGVVDTAVTLTATQELTNKTLNASVAKGTWTASGTWTLPAFTLGGAITGNNQNISGLGAVAATSFAGALNGTVGATTPAAGKFTTIDASGNVTLGDAATDTVTVNGVLGVGGTAGDINGHLKLAGATLTGAATARGIRSGQTIQSNVTTSYFSFLSIPAIVPASFTLTDLAHYCTTSVSIGSGAVVTNQYGYQSAALAGATNNYGFYSASTNAAGRWNFYAAGDAPNYFAGVVNVEDGTALLPSIVNNGDPNTGLWFPAADTVAVSTGGVERVRVDSSGNVGLGVTPGAWTATNFIGLQIGAGASFAGRHASQGSPYDEMYLSANAVYEGAWKRIGAAAATQYYQDAGTHVFRFAASDAAGSAITWTTGLSISAAGLVTIPGALATEDGTALLPSIVNNGDPNTGIWFPAADTVAVSTGGTERWRADSSGLDISGAIEFNPGASVTPADNGDVVFELTNNTTLTIKAKGSDGTVRSVALTLA